jgi:hypothetical protein
MDDDLSAGGEIMPDRHVIIGLLFEKTDEIARE